MISTNMGSMWEIFKKNMIDSSKLYIPTVNDVGSREKYPWRRPLNSEKRA